MGFWGFVRANLAPAAWATIAILVGTWGFASDAYEVWTAGMKPEFLQFSGFVLFVSSCISMLYRQHKMLERRLSRAEQRPAPVANVKSSDEDTHQVVVRVDPAARPARPIKQPFTINDEQKRKFVDLIVPLRPLQPRITIKRSTAGSSNITMYGNLREVFERAGYNVTAEYMPPTAPNQEGLYICYDASAAQPPRLAAELALAFKEIGFSTAHAPLPPGSGANEVVVYVGATPL